MNQKIAIVKRIQFMAVFALATACSTELDRLNPFDEKTDPANQATSELSGKVTLAGESDFAGIEIRLDGPTRADVSTQANGNFALNGIVPGTYKIVISTRGFVEVTLPTVDIGLGGRVELDPIVLALRRAAVAGTVSSSDSTLLTASGAFVAIHRVAGPRASASAAPYHGQAEPVTSTTVDALPQQAVVAPDGTYQFADVPAGIWELVVSKEGAAPERTQFTVTGDLALVTAEPLQIKPLTGGFVIEGALVDGTVSAVYTAQRQVNLRLDGFNAVSMRLGEQDSGECVYGESQGFTATATYTLSAGDGVKTVCVKFLDNSGHETDDITSQILLDETAPSFSILRINGGEAYTTDRTVLAEVFGLDEASGLEGIEVARTALTTFDRDYAPTFNDTLPNNDGVYVYTVRLRDRAGHYSAAITDSVILDRTLPVAGSLVLAAGATYSSSAVVTAALSASGATDMQVSTDASFAGAAWVPYAASVNVLLPPPDGSKSVYARFRDEAGNVSATVAQDDIVLDSTPPTGVSVSGPSAVSSTTVTLTVTGQDSMGSVLARISEDPSFLGADWFVLPLPSTVTDVIVSGGDGARTLYVQFRDSISNLSGVLTHSLTVDSTPPQDAALSFQAGDIIRTQAATLVLAADGANEVLLSQASDFAGAQWVPLSLTKTFTLDAGDGLKTVYARYRDLAHNMTAAVSATTLLDTSAPNISLFMVNGGQVGAAPGPVTVQIAATDASALQIKLWVDNESSASYQPYLTSTSVQIPSVDGAHTVGLKVKDAAGNESSAGTFVLNVDGTPPNSASVQINGAAPYALTHAVALAVSASGATQVRVSENPSLGGASWTAIAAMPFNLSSGDGSKTVYAQFRDAAGNLSEIVSDTIIVDTTPPSGVSVLIDGGAVYNVQTGGLLSVSLAAIDANGLSQMKVLTKSASDTCSGTSLATVRSVADSLVETYVNAGPGREEQARVCVQVSDPAGNWSSPASDTIIYDTSAPAIASFELNGGDNLTTALTVTAEVNATGSPVQMRMSAACGSGSWEPYVSLRSVSLSEGLNLRTMTLRDAAGNTSGCVSRSITVDNIGPATPVLTINDGMPELTSSTDVEIKLSSDASAAYIEIAEDVGFISLLYSGNWMATQSVALAEIQGLRTVYVRYFDAAGNSSPIGVDTIELDTEAPIVNGVEIDAGATYNNQSSGLLNIAVSAFDASGLQTMRYLSRSGSGCAGINNQTTENFASQFSRTYVNAGVGVEHTARVCVRVSDAAGNWADVVSDTVQYDTAPPVAGSPSVSINGGDTSTSNTGLLISLSATGASEMQLSADSGFAGAAWVPYVTSAGFTVDTVDGNKTVYVRFRDAAGNTTLGSNDSITLDRSSPSGIALQAPAVVSGATAGLTLSASDSAVPMQMRLSESPTFTGASWIAYGTSNSFALSAGDGMKTIYAQFRDALLNTSEILTTSLTRDGTAPGSPSLSIQQGAYTQTAAITLVLGADNATEVRVSESPTLSGASWQPMSGTKTFTLSAPAGGVQNKTVYAQYRDTANNRSAIVSAAVIYDSANPTAPTVTINGMAAETNSANVILSLGCPSDAVLMQISNVSNFAGSNWEAVTTTVNWNLGGGGTVYVKVRDASGRESSVQSDSIVVDTSAPIFTGFSVTPAGSTNNVNVTLNLVYSGASQMQLAVEPTFAGASWMSAVPATAYSLPSGDGIKTIYARLRDTAGNVSAVLSTIVTLDTGAPIGAQIVLDNGAIYSQDALVDVAMASAGATEYCKGQSPSLPSCAWAPMAATTTHSFSGGDGTRTLYIKFRDGSGNETAIVNDSIVLDTVNPSSVSVSIAEGSLVRSRTVNLTLSATDVNPMQMQISNDSGFTGAQWEDYVPTKLWTLASGVDGLRSVHFKVRDASGRTVTATAASTTLDGTAPNAPYISVVQGAATNQSKVTLQLTANGADKVIVSEDAGFAGTSPTTYNGLPRAFTLSGGTGTKTIYARFDDNAGNSSAIVSAVIVRDTVAPSSVTAAIQQGDYTTSQQITLQLYAQGADYVMASQQSNFSGATWYPYAATLPFTLTAAQNFKYVYVKFKDQAGNESATVKDGIRLDYTAPTGGTLALTGSHPAQQKTNNRTIAATVSGLTGASEEQVSLSPLFIGADWRSAGSSHSLYLSGNDGVTTVYARARDNAGNVGVAFSAQITLDTVAPDLLSAVLRTASANPAAFTNSQSVTLETTYVGDPVTLVIKENATTLFSGAYAAGKNISLLAGNGTHTLAAYLEDAIGNRSETLFASVVLDTLPPSASILINDGAAYTQTRSVTLDLLATDSGSGVPALGIKLANSSSAIASTAAVAFVSPKLHDLASGQGTRTVYYQVLDAAGNKSAILSDSIVRDSVAPAGGAIDIVAARTNQIVTDATVTVPADAVLMKISQGNNSCTGGVWTTTDTAVSVVLDGSNTTQFVSVQFQDAAGNTSTCSSDSVIFDSEGPVIASFTLSGSAGSASGYSRTSTVSFSFATSDGDCSAAQISADIGFATATDLPLDCNGDGDSYTFVPAYDGFRTLYLRIRDTTGNYGPTAAASVIVDTVTPSVPGTGAFSIQQGSYTNSTAINLLHYVAGATKYRANTGISCAASGAYTLLAANTSYTLPSGDGSKTVWVRYSDDASNTTACTSKVINLDTNADGGTAAALSVTSLTGSNTKTASQVIQAGITFADADIVYMMVGNDAAFTGAVTRPYDNYFTHSLNSGDGTKTIYVRLYDRAGNTVVKTDTITLDQTPPTSASLSLSETPATNVTAWTVALGATGGSFVRLADNSGMNGYTQIAYAAGNYDYTLPNTANGVKNVYVQYCDDVLNCTAALQVSGVLDRTAPVYGGISINAGATVVADLSGNVTLTLTATDNAGGAGVATVRLSNALGTVGAAAPVNFEGFKAWVLGTPLGAGIDTTKTVYAIFRDAAGNQSATYNDDIKYDTLKPDGAVGAVNFPFTRTNSRVTEVAITAPSDAVQMKLSAGNACAGGIWENVATTRDWFLDDVQGTQYVSIQFKDAAGNESSNCRSDSIIYDSIGPNASSFTATGTGGATAGYSLSNSVTLNWSTAAADCNLVQISEDIGFLTIDASSTTCVAGSLGTFTFSPTFDGVHTVYLRMRDTTGNYGQPAAVNVIVDTSVPTVTGGGIVISEGEYYNAADISLSLTASGASEMRIVEGAVCSGSYVAYQPDSTLTLNLTKPFFVTDTVQQSTVNAGMWPVRTSSPGVSSGAVGEPSAPYSINLDFADGIESATFAAGANRYYRYSWQRDNAVTLVGETLKFEYYNGTVWTTINTHTGLDGAINTFYQVSGALPATAQKVRFVVATGSTSDDFYLDDIAIYATGGAAEDGYHMVSAMFRDTANNQTACYKDYIYIDRVVPTLNVTIAGAEAVAGRTALNSVTLNFTYAVDAKEIMISNLAGFPGGAWQPIAASTSWQLLSGDGTKTVYAKVRDAAGNESIDDTDSIVLDATPPDPAYIALADIDADGYALNDDEVELAWTSTGDPNAVDYQLQRRVMGVDADYSTIATLSAATFSYRNTGLSAWAGKTINYRIRARDNLNLYSPWSNVAAAQPAAAISEGVLVTGRDSRLYLTPEPGITGISGIEQYVEGFGSIRTLNYPSDQLTWYRDAWDTFVRDESLELRFSNSDGSLVYDVDFTLPTNEAFSIPNPDAAVLGGHEAVAVDSTGNRHICLISGGNLYYTNSTGNTWAVPSLIDDTANTFESCSIVSYGDYVHIAYLDQTADRIRYINKSISTNTWSIATNPSVLTVSKYVSIDVNRSNGNVYIGFVADSSLSLRYISSANGGSSWSGSTSVFDPGGTVMTQHAISMEVDTAGAVHFSFFFDGSGANNKIVYAKWTGSLVTTVVDSSSVEAESALAVDGDGVAHIAYRDTGGLALAYWNNLSGARKELALNSTFSTGYYPSIDVSSHNNPVIAVVNVSDVLSATMDIYAEDSGLWGTQQLSLSTFSVIPAVVSTGGLKFAIVAPNNAGGLKEFALRQSASHSHYTDDWMDFDLVTDANGFVHICALNDSNSNLAYITDSGTEKRIQATTVNNAATNSCAIALDSNGKVHIVFVANVSNDLVYITNKTGVWSATTTIHSTNNTGQPSLRIDASNNLHVAYYDTTNANLRYAYKTLAAASFTDYAIASADDVGSASKMLVNASGLPRIVTQYKVGTTTQNVRVYKSSAADGSGSWTVNTVATNATMGGATYVGTQLNVFYNSDTGIKRASANTTGESSFTVYHVFADATVGDVISNASGQFFLGAVSGNGTTPLYIENESGEWNALPLGAENALVSYSSPKIAFGKNGDIAMTYNFDIFALFTVINAGVLNEGIRAPFSANSIQRVQTF